MKKSGGATKDVASMTSKWNQHAAKVTKEAAQKLMSGIKKKVRKFYENDEL